MQVRAPLEQRVPMLSITPSLEKRARFKTYLRYWRRPGTLRLLIRRSELALIAFAALTGLAAGALVAGMSEAVQAMHEGFFGIIPGTRLSESDALIYWYLAFVPAVGGIVLWITIVLAARLRRRPIVDPIEANALHGGRMSMIDGIIVVTQTLISNGFGTSVGLEAGYTQIAAAVGSRIGRSFELRRNEMRLLVGCGAAAAIAGAFNAPLTGTFYAVELVVGSYSVVALAPLMTASLCGAGLTRVLIGRATFFDAPMLDMAVHPDNYAPAILLGCLSAAFGIAIMQSVTAAETAFRRIGVPTLFRLVIGGLMVGSLALISPQVLSSGHGALHLDIEMSPGLTMLALLILLKSLASIISIGSGFRGGLFFASLLLGALFGTLFARTLASLSPALASEPALYALVGMSSLGATIIGGPLTMTFLALEASRDFAVTGLVLVAVVTASVITRKTFGYSFATWRFHLRGESIRGAYDIGWINTLTVGSMMRADVRTAPSDMTVVTFRQAFPIGSTQRVIVTDREGRYQGMLIVSDAHSDHHDDMAAVTPIRDLLILKEAMLFPQINAKEAAMIFETTASEALAVVDSSSTRRVVGLLTESHTLRRYAEELDKRRGELLGERVR